LHKFYSPHKFKIAFCHSLLLRIISAFYHIEFLPFPFPELSNLRFIDAGITDLLCLPITLLMLVIPKKGAQIEFFSETGYITVKARQCGDVFPGLSLGFLCGSLRSGFRQERRDKTFVTSIPRNRRGSSRQAR